MTGVLNDVSAATVCDVLHDPAYRETWDYVMRGLEDLSSLNIGHQKTAKYVTISVCIGTMVFGTCNNL